MSTGDDKSIRWGKVIAQCWRDDAYKSRLLDEPRAVLTEAGIDVPGGVDLMVTEEQPGQMHLVLPQKPEMAEGQIDDKLLEPAAGGICCCSCFTGP